MKQNITFGTSGHRGIMGQDMTQRHVWAIGQAVADYLEKTNETKSIIIGYDPREGNDPLLEEGSFTRTLVESLHHRDITSYLCNTYTPTPVISWAIRYGDYGGGLILTASHNPPEYNGIKFNPNPGQPAPIDVTEYLQEKANRYFLLPFTETFTLLESLNLERVNPIPDFSLNIIQLCSHLIPKTDPLPSVAIDCKYGACASTWKDIFTRLNSPYTLIHDTPLPTFGHQSPNPTDISSLDTLRSKKMPLSFSNDPDGDRHVILDENGTDVSPELITVLIADYLLKLGHPIKGIATTLASSTIIQSFTNAHHLTYEETEVGFKFMYPFLSACAKESQLGLAVESSGGFTLSSHTYEKCGFLPCVLVLFICAHSQQPLSSLISKLKETYGSYVFLESLFRYETKQKQELLSHFKLVKTDVLETYFGPINSMDKRDGVKLIFENSWLLFRFSGTEPLIRIYAESLNLEQTQHLLKQGYDYLKTL
jgi:phosphoglucomutase